MTSNIPTPLIREDSNIAVNILHSHLNDIVFKVIILHFSQEVPRLSDNMWSSNTFG